MEKEGGRYLLARVIIKEKGCFYGNEYDKDGNLIIALYDFGEKTVCEYYDPKIVYEPKE